MLSSDETWRFNPPSRGAEFRILSLDGRVTSFSYTVTAPDVEGTYDFSWINLSLSGTFETSNRPISMLVAIPTGNRGYGWYRWYRCSNPDEADAPNPLKLSSKVAGAAVQVVADATAGMQR